MQKSSTVNVKIIWKHAPSSGTIKVKSGSLQNLAICCGEGKCENSTFYFDNKQNGGVAVNISDITLNHTTSPTLITVHCDDSSFSFILRDALFPENPIYISEYNVLAVCGDDKRNYNEIITDINSIKRKSDFERFECEEEESWETAVSRNRKQYSPIWLSTARDIRIFRVGYIEEMGFWGEIIPVYHSLVNFFDPDTRRNIEKILFAVGQGSACSINISRRLENGTLPILNSIQKEDSITYNLTTFATLESTPLNTGQVKGTDFLTGYAHFSGNMLKEENQKELIDSFQKELKANEEEIICRFRITAVNKSESPSYAWFKTPYYEEATYTFDAKKGYSYNKDGDVFSIATIDGKPVYNEEMAILIQPRDSVVFEFMVPHSPISQKRADKLKQQNFEKHRDGAIKYWQDKLDSKASISIPEPTINELVQAGLLHCDIASIGREPDGPIAATIGWYAPIGTESAPIIQFFDSMGWHDIAERSIEFFLKRQRDDGFIQNYLGYESETGPLLWTMGEHFRYTRDTKWLKRVKPHIDKACEYLLAWRNKNKTEELRGTRCYGLVDGKVADPDDFYHQFFLNAGTYAGLKRCVEMYEEIDAEQADKLRKEVAEYRNDLRKSFYATMAESPVIPTGNGTWAPLMQSWADDVGATALYTKEGKWFTHGSFLTRETLTTPLYLVFHEVLDANEIGTTLMLKANQSPATVENAGLSQPYYCRHDFAHVKRGEIKAFLKMYYNQLTGLIDQETYSFWEHYHHASQHKTHEEAWFLMQTRWMLYIEDENDLKLFSAIPRKWLNPGEEIKLNNVVSYFGKLNVKATCSNDGKSISCEVNIDSNRIPENLLIRLPHFDFLKPENISGGTYDTENETITVSNFTGQCKVTLIF